MAYYYRSHIKNLEDEATLEKQKIAAELHEKELINSRKKQTSQRSPQKGLKRSRREEDSETAAYLERSRLQAQLSATRTKAENTMNRSRLEAAFNLRKQNQKAMDELDQLSIRHERMKDLALKQEVQAHNSFLESKRIFEEKTREEDYLYERYLRQKNHMDIELTHAQRMAQLERDHFYYYP